MPANRRNGEQDQPNTWQLGAEGRDTILNAMGWSALTPTRVMNIVRNMIGDGSRDRIKNLVEEIVHSVVSRQKNDNEDPRNEETSCISCGLAIGFLMRVPVRVLYQETQVEDQATVDMFQQMVQELHNHNIVSIHINLYGTEHVFGIIPLSDGEAFVLHAWQDIHGVRAERAMEIEELVNLLEQLPQNNEVQQLLWNEIRAVPDRNRSRGHVSFITVMAGMLGILNINCFIKLPKFE